MRREERRGEREESEKREKKREESVWHAPVLRTTGVVEERLKVF